MKKLWIEYAAVWVVAVVMYFTLPQGALSGDYMLMYLAEYLCIALTLFFIYFSLRLLASPGVKTRIRQGGEPAFVRFWEIRLAMLALPLFLSLGVYAATVESTCGFCALITLFALFFVTPSQKEKDALLKEE